MRIASLGHAVFALTLIGLGIQGFAAGDFAAIWHPVAKDAPAREALVYVCALLSLGCGAGLLWPGTAAVAARVLFGWLLLWIVVFRLPVLVRALATQDAWSGLGETAVYAAAAWVLCVWFATGRGASRSTADDRGVRAAQYLYGAAMIPFGIAHFSYLKETASLVPSWLPGPTVWAAATGCAYLAAGVALLSGVGARLAAALTTLQMGLFTVLVWLPIVSSGKASAFAWSESVVSWVLTASAWVVADSYRGVPWLALRRRSG